MLITTKIGMTQIWDESGKLRPVTVLRVPAQKIIRKKTVEKDGYDAVLVGTGDGPKSRAAATIREFRGASDAPEAGTELALGDFTEKKSATLVGTSKGKGTQGPVKRHNFAMTRKSHGGHGSSGRRKGGSIGCRIKPGEVEKGKKMAGRMGVEKITLKNRVVEKVDAERGVILIRGAVPGPRGSMVTVAWDA